MKGLYVVDWIGDDPTSGSLMSFWVGTTIDGAKRAASVLAGRGLEWGPGTTFKDSIAEARGLRDGKGGLYSIQHTRLAGLYTLLDRQRRPSRAANTKVGTANSRGTM
jgi:hypothetical protein